MMYIAGTLGSLAALAAGLLGLLYTGHRWADHYRQAPATVDNEYRTDNPTPILDAEPADVDEWTTDVELWLRDHTALNNVEETLRVGLDDAYTRFKVVLGVDETDLLDHPGFVGVRELVGAVA